jgi:hypothetical protein
VFHKPADNVREGFNRALQAFHVLDLIELFFAMGCWDGQGVGKNVVKANVIAEEDIRPKRNVVNAD